MSENFARKMQRREERAGERKLLQEAKVIFAKLYPEKSMSLFRNRVETIKRKLKSGHYKMADLETITE